MADKVTKPAASTAAKPAAAAQDSGVSAATSVTPSGAPDQIVPDVDLDHPAVDADPRKNTTADMNRIDFNDPTISGAEAVARNLADQAKG